MPYTVPQVIVNQSLSEIAAEIVGPLRAMLIGPNANLFRYADEDEKTLAYVGTYNSAVDTTVDWPNKTAGSVIDLPYTKLFADKARLRYFSDLISSGSTIRAVSGYKNRIRSTTVAFADNNNVDRSASLYDRDVALGDVVYIRGTYAGDTEELWTYVRGLVAEAVASAVADVDTDAANAGNQSQDITITQTAGDVNELSLSASLSTYNALIDGDIDDIYTVTVISGSAGADPSTGLLRVTSASGYEYETNVVPGTLGTYFTVGKRNLRLRFTASGVSEGISEGVDVNDLIPGQTWTVRVKPAFTAPTVESGGTYVGAIDNTYVVTVVSGGLFADEDTSKRPRLAISTVRGSDGLSNVVPELAVPVALGTGGATLKFTGVTGLRKGDKFYVDVTAETTGRMSTLVLGHNLSTVLQNATDLDLKLYIQKDGLEIDKYVTAPTPGYNWETDAADGVTINAGINVYDSSWTSDGVEQALPLESAELYVEYREWLNELVGDIGSLSDITEIDVIPGPLDPDNPLKWAASKCVANAGGTGIRVTAVADPTDNEDWVAALGICTERQDLYNLVPLTNDKSIHDLFVAHVNSMSSPTRARWRRVIVPLTAEEVKPVVTAALSDDEETVLGTITDDANETGTQYTFVSITSDNAGFLELGVRAGDVLRTNFNTNPVGETTYDEYVVDQVLNETSLVLVSGPDTAISVAQKIEVHHNRTATELATYIGQLAGSYGNRRVTAVWPDVVGSAGVTFEGFHMCAAVAGLASGVVPQQNLTNVQIVGFDDLNRTTKLFTAEQLDIMAENGVWIVTKGLDGTVYTRDALTTDMTSLQTKTEMYTRNLDSISYVLRSRLVQYIGRANVVKGTMDQIAIDLISGIEFLKTNGYTARLGGQLIDATITEIRQSILQKDQIVITIELTLPFPVNVITLTLVA